MTEPPFTLLRAPSVQSGAHRRASVQRPAFVISELRPGGAERVVVLLASVMHEQGLRPAVVCLQGKGALAGELEQRGIPVYALGSTLAYDIAAMFRLRTLLTQLGSDVINAHDRWSLPYVVMSNWGSRRLPVVFSAHGLMFGEPERGRLKYRLAARWVTAVTAVSEEVATRHAKYFRFRARADIVPNGVPDHGLNPSDRERMRRHLGIASGTFVFLAVGNARPEKGYEDLLSAAALLPGEARGRAWLALVAGRLDEGPYCTSLVAQQKCLNLDESVRFLGFQADIGTLYAAADALVLSSRSEGLPMVILEAMMAGIPVIATRVGGVPHVVHECGLLVDACRPDALCRAMGQLLMDPGLAECLARKGRQRAIEKHSVERMATGYLQVYEKAVVIHHSLELG